MQNTNRNVRAFCRDKFGKHAFGKSIEDLAPRRVDGDTVLQIEDDRTNGDNDFAKKLDAG